MVIWKVLILAPALSRFQFGVWKMHASVFLLLLLLFSSWCADEHHLRALLETETVPALAHS